MNVIFETSHLLLLLGVSLSWFPQGTPTFLTEQVIICGGRKQ